MEFRDLKKQYQHLKSEIDGAVQDVAAAGNYIMGKPVKELEEELAEYVGVKHCLTCANGTDALTLALKAIGIGKGDAVFVPDFTFFASAEVIALEGATPVFIDVNPNTFNIDCTSLENALSSVREEGVLKPKAIIAVDLFGLPADHRHLRTIADREGLYIIEDGAQGFGGHIEDGTQARRLRKGGKRACGYGDIGTTSFFPAKPLGCYGDGGAVFTDNDEWAQLIESFRVHGKGSYKYDNVRIGMNSRLDTLQAAILKVKFNAFQSHELADVNKCAELYSHFINDNLHGIVTPPMVPDGYYSSWAQYTIRLNGTQASRLREKNSLLRDAIQTKMKENGIPTMVYYPIPMSKQTAFKGLHQYVETPNAAMLSGSVFSLPMHPYLTENDIKTVVKSLVCSL